MATFVEKYVRRPIAEVDACVSDLLKLSISNLPAESVFLVEISNQQETYSWRIHRHEDPALAKDLEEVEAVENGEANL